MVYQYQVSDWDAKKTNIKKYIDDNKFTRLDKFDCDKGNNNYRKEFSEIFHNELECFASEIHVSHIDITSVWCVKYQKGDWHIPHTHSTFGFSGVLYLDYDEQLHTGTFFINQITNPITDETDISYPTVKEGTITIAPSNVLHYTQPNQSDKIRSIIGFDLKLGR